jgi:RNA polymerase sigma factor (sigma-70 family)
MENAMMANYAAPRENLTGSNNTDLVLAAKKGDLEAFNQMVLLYQERIYALALRILGDEDSAEDITQNTFLTAYLNLPRFRNGSFRSWLYRIATNACYDELRRRKSHPILSLEYEDEAEEKLMPLYDFTRPSMLPEKEVEKHQLEQSIQQALNRLDADQRAVVVLVDLQDFDYQEAAHILEVPIGTVKSRLVRARLKLRRLLVGPFGLPVDGHQYLPGRQGKG